MIYHECDLYSLLLGILFHYLKHHLISFHDIDVFIQKNINKNSFIKFKDHFGERVIDFMFILKYLNYQHNQTIQNVKEKCQVL